MDTNLIVGDVDFFDHVYGGQTGAETSSVVEGEKGNVKEISQAE